MMRKEPVSDINSQTDKKSPEQSIEAFAFHRLDKTFNRMEKFDREKIKLLNPIKVSDNKNHTNDSNHKGFPEIHSDKELLAFVKKQRHFSVLEQTEMEELFMLKNHAAAFDVFKNGPLAHRIFNELTRIEKNTDTENYQKRGVIDTLMRRVDGMDGIQKYTLLKLLQTTDLFILSGLHQYAKHGGSNPDQANLRKTYFIGIATVNQLDDSTLFLVSKVRESDKSYRTRRTDGFRDMFADR